MLASIGTAVVQRRGPFSHGVVGDVESFKKRELVEKLKTADDATVQMVIEMLEAAVRSKQRQIPSNMNPKTTPR